MGLKIATFTRINQYGETENIYLTWSGASINYAAPGSILFAAFENQTEAQRNNRKDTFSMTVTTSDTLSMFQRIGNVALEISDASWQMAAERQFIPSRVEVEGEPEMQLHSLTDLNAEIIDIGLPF